MILPYSLRQKLRWEGRSLDAPVRSRFPESDEPVSDRAGVLMREYGLERWKGLWTRETYDEVLGILDLLDRAPKSQVPKGPGRPEEAAPLRILDVGSKNWQYLGALAAWADRRFGRPVEFTGAEIDAYRMYADGRTRAACARFFMRACEQVLPRQSYRFVADDVRSVRGPFDEVTWFLPFLHESTHRAWGLPMRIYAPEALFRHVAGQMRSGAGLLLLNQGEWEWTRARELLESLGALRLESVQAVEGSLHASVHTLFLSRWICRRDP